MRIYNQQELEQFMLDTLKNTFKVEATSNTNLQDAGIDSLDVIELAIELNMFLQFEVIDPVDADANNTVADFVLNFHTHYIEKVGQQLSFDLYRHQIPSIYD